MKKGQISQEVFNEICDRLRRMNGYSQGTNAHDLLIGFFPDLMRDAGSDTAAALEGAFSAALALADRDNFGLNDVSAFMHYFQALWDLTAAEPRDCREEYLAALRPYLDSGLLTEAFWSADFSVLHFDNGLYGLFDYRTTTGRFRGAMTDERSLLKVMKQYAVSDAAYRKCGILDEARMLVSVGDFEAATVNNNLSSYSYETNWVGAMALAQSGAVNADYMAMRSSGHGRFRVTVFEVEELRESDVHSRGSLKNIVETYRRCDYATLLKTIIYYSMRPEMRTVMRLYLAIEKFLSNCANLLLLNNYLELKRADGEITELREPSDLEPFGRYNDENSEELLHLNEKYHRSEWEAEDRAREKEEKGARIEAYWQSHPEEKEALDREEKECRETIASLAKELDRYHDEMREVEKESTESLADEVRQVSDEINRLADSVFSISLFKRKERREVQEKIDALKGKRRGLEVKLREEEASLKARKEQRKKELTDQYGPMLAQKEKLEKRLSAIFAERAKDR